MREAGYSLEVNDRGGVTLTVKSSGKTAKLESKTRVNDGQWYHVVAEADRATKTLALYVDGKKDKSASVLSNNGSLENENDLYVGGTPSGRYFKGTLDFLRICLGTLADSKTDIGELYAWQFNGPFLRDFAGRQPVGKRDAGALEGGERE